MTMHSTIESKLADALQPTVLEVSNESHMHSVPANSETHFKVVVVSEDFLEKPLLARHRLINKLLADELKGGVHALALHTFTAAEWAARGQASTNSPECRGGSAAENQ